MDTVILGRTGITTAKNGFGALPIQRIGKKEAQALLLYAYNNGITFFDTARFYTDSEEKIGLALSGVRDKIYIASKTMAANPKEFWRQLETSLKYLRTDYLDIYQFHNPAFCPKPGDGSGLYEAMLEAKAKGMIRHIGITNHRLHLAIEAAESGLYETIQYPLSYLSTEEELAFVRMCGEKQIGVIAMKALSGGLITNAAAAYAFLAQFPHVLPIWGIQRQSELDEFLSFSIKPPVLDAELQVVIDRDRKELSGDFCRGCGYCLPCPAEIDIPTCARMSLTIRRYPTSLYLNSHWQAEMKKIENCQQCGQCRERCPYGLDTPRLLAQNWADYQQHI